MKSLPADNTGKKHIEDYLRVYRTENDSVDPISGKRTYIEHLDYSPVFPEWSRYLKDFRYKLSNNEFNISDDRRDEIILDIDKVLAKPEQERTLEDYTPFFFPLITQDKTIEIPDVASVDVPTQDSAPTSGTPVSTSASPTATVPTNDTPTGSTSSISYQTGDGKTYIISIGDEGSATVSDEQGKPID